MRGPSERAVAASSVGGAGRGHPVRGGVPVAGPAAGGSPARLCAEAQAAPGCDHRLQRPFAQPENAAAAASLPHREQRIPNSAVHGVLPGGGHARAVPSGAVV